MRTRRTFIAGLGAAAAWPLAVRAQQATNPVVGLLFSGTPEETSDQVAGLLRGLSETGFVDGRNIAVEYRYDPHRAPELAADLVNRRVAVIATNSAGAALRAKAATATIPVVFVATADAVQVGLVTSVARPGGNITGINSMVAALGGKRFEFLHELLPQAVRYGLLVDPTVPAFEADIAMAQSAAKATGLSLEVFNAGTIREIDAAFTRVLEQRIEALAIAPARLFLDRRVQLTTVTVRHALPTIFFDRKSAEVGGLMSYSPNTVDEFRQAGVYVGRILKGEKPADLPVLQPTKFELVINQGTANAFGLTIPPTLLATADEVIE